VRSEAISGVEWSELVGARETFAVEAVTRRLVKTQQAKQTLNV
jgi:hypothetical protein